MFRVQDSRVFRVRFRAEPLGMRLVLGAKTQLKQKGNPRKDPSFRTLKNVNGLKDGGKKKTSVMFRHFRR